MMANDSTEMAQTVKTARISRRTKYVSTRSLRAQFARNLTEQRLDYLSFCALRFLRVNSAKNQVVAGGVDLILRSAQNDNGCQLALVEEGHRARDAGSLAVRAVVVARGDVAQVVLGDSHAHRSGAHADDADHKDLVGGGLPDLLAEPDPLVIRRAVGLAEVQHHLLNLGRRLLAQLAIRLEPLGVKRPTATGRFIGEDVGREGVEVLAAVVVPGVKLVLVGRVALDAEGPLHLLDLQIDPDLLHLLADHLHDPGPLEELPAPGRHHQAQPSLAIGPLAEALTVPLVQPELVEHVV